MSFARNLCNKYGKQLLRSAAKTGLDALITASKKVVHKADEATDKCTGKRIAEKIAKPNLISEGNLRDVEEEILNELRQVLQKWNSIKYLNYQII